VEKEATEDIDAVEEQGTLCVTQTALKEMRLRYEDQCAARREAERVRLVLIHLHTKVNLLCSKTRPS
jgi:hypothetical protein